MKNTKYTKREQNRNPKMIVRLTKTEYELDDGTIHPIPFEMEELPTIEEFQTIYDEWFRLFQQKNLIVSEEFDDE